MGMLNDIYMILLFDTEMIFLNYKRNMHRSFVVSTSPPKKTWNLYSEIVWD